MINTAIHGAALHQIMHGIIIMLLIILILHLLLQHDSSNMLRPFSTASIPPSGGTALFVVAHFSRALRGPSQARCLNCLMRASGRPASMRWVAPTGITNILVPKPGCPPQRALQLIYFMPHSRFPWPCLLSPAAWLAGSTWLLGLLPSQRPHHHCLFIPPKLCARLLRRLSSLPNQTTGPAVSY